MAVDDIIPIKFHGYSGIGDYEFNFPALLTTDLYCYVVLPNGTTRVLVKDTDYTATLATAPTVGGIVSLIADNHPTAVRLVLARNMPYTQTTDWQNGGPLDQPLLTRAFDRVTMLVQQLRTDVTGITASSSWRGDWAATEVYSAKDMVRATNGNWYYCLEDHTSSADFSTDLAAGKWLLALDVVYIDQRAQDASAAAIEAKASEDAAAVSETNAAASASSASASAGIAITQAGIATTQAGIATTKASEAAASAAEAASLVIVGERSDAIYPDYYVATAGQENFTITHPAPKENILVFMNSRKLRLTDDYTLDSDIAASTLTLTTAAEGGEEVDIISINTYDLTGSAEDMANLLSQTKTQATNAANSASAAAGSASAAAGSASAASTSATNAANSATSSSSYATNSQNSATAAAGSASTATTQAGIAATQAGNAATSATNAANSATAADASADAAAASALLADGYAEAAAVSATEAEAATALLNKKITVLQNELLDRCLPAVSKILATTANLVDVFVYNTYEDYDGGLWTENANYQSWYIEQLNTATRGSKREFPKVALIVAETNKVTIYDATETDCPMWATQAPAGVINLLTSCWCSNGVLSFGSSSYVAMFNLLTSEWVVITATDKRVWAGSKFSAYGTQTVTDAATKLVNTAVNDIAMTTISRTENAYGLLDPVIVAFTDGGVSVIDGAAGVGTVVDSEVTLTTTKMGCINSDGRIAWGRGTAATDLRVSVDPITSISADAWLSRVYTSSSTPAVAPISMASTAHVASGDIIRGGNGMLTKLSEDTTTQTNGMVAYITDKYNTGWLKGYIMRAMICEAEAVNLVTNGTFDSDTAWTKGTGWTISGGKANCDGSQTTYSMLTQDGMLTIGKAYTVTFDAIVSAGSIYVGIGKPSDIAGITTSGRYTYTATATTQTYLRFEADDPFVGSIDNVIVQEVETLTNLVTNGTFDSDTGWTKGTGWTIGGGVASSDGSQTADSFLTQTVALVDGSKYAITYTATITAGGVYPIVGGNSAAVRTVSGTYTEIITAASIDSVIISANADFIGSIDNVIVTEVIPDRSVKASSLTVNGSLTRSPVAAGAELQAISGYSTVNYMSQAYSADLDVGTGDFYICGWLKENPNSADEIILQRAFWTGSAYTGSIIQLYVLADGKLSALISDDAAATVDQITSTAAINDSTYGFVLFQRVGTKLELWRNSVKIASDVTIANASGTLSNASAILQIGRRTTGSAPLTNGTLALLRIGSGSLSAAQIAKMYREELALFQPGAKCTIQGASSAVTALAYNERYNKLLVGTSAGVTVFDNLTVDDNFYTSTASIKALASAGKAVLEANTANAKLTVDNQEFARFSSKTMMTPEGGIAHRVVNRTGAASVKGYLVSASPDYDYSVRLTPIGSPDCIGVCYEDGVPDGSEMWIVKAGDADVYFSGSATRGHYARTGFTDDTGEVAGQAISEAIPSSPFATDKHFAEIGHVLASRTGAGLTRVSLHFN